jgi:peptidoglycan/xylan/chitin deacetylase (PgdA/CDA1 family)
MLPSDEAAAFLDFLAHATSSGRCDGTVAAGTWMTWDMLREMQAGGMTIGGHTVNHPILARCDRDRQRAEIVDCGRRLMEELGQPLRWFSYPRGKPDAFNADTRACLAEAGVQLAFTYYGGFRRFDDWDPLDVRRVAIELDQTFDHFRAVLTVPQMFARTV